MANYQSQDFFFKLHEREKLGSVLAPFYLVICSSVWVTTICICTLPIFYLFLPLHLVTSFVFMHYKFLTFVLLLFRLCFASAFVYISKEVQVAVVLAGCKRRVSLALGPLFICFADCS